MLVAAVVVPKTVMVVQVVLVVVALAGIVRKMARQAQQIVVAVAEAEVSVLHNTITVAQAVAV
ncbi:MAG: hypothetical protein EBR82_81330 [Caulobacteraceae bacterium]|nr:hypothetical protein [Caulobacteraceae bacterium]